VTLVDDAIGVLSTHDNDTSDQPTATTVDARRLVRLFEELVDGRPDAEEVAALLHEPLW